MRGWLRAIGLALCVTACAPPSGISRVPLMQAPILYQSAAPAPAAAPRVPADRDVPYATQRAPAEIGAYGDVPSTILRVGFSEVSIGASRTSGAAGTRRPVVEIEEVAETGPLTASRHAAADPRDFNGTGPEVDAAFAGRINRQLAERPGGDIVLYVHGTWTDFANPVLAAAELQHVSGYHHLFMAYSWPANTGLLTYFQDTEDATNSAFQFRRYLRFLAEETEARRIHIVAHSAGTRMVSEAIGALALEYKAAPESRIRTELRLGQVMLIGSDADPIRVGGYLIDGIDRMVEDLTIYVSGHDRALRLSNIVFGERNRLGQATRGPVPAYIRGFIGSFDNVHVIDVTDAERSSAANGHGYLRGSPWVSSDILAAVTLGLDPAGRGLVRSRDRVRWIFPANYPERLQAMAGPRLPRDGG
ncbi:alpha/beta hydrolase [Jannaschia marina]|uniref:alpha/beta hydrolase n=1 Tax=Jannaschia marina TaxID=2741674 RepID=UPI0015C88352|nr:alpha/beta hydrolase [Jannaschia marina]